MTPSEVTSAFYPVPGGAACYFWPIQAEILRSLVAEVAELVQADQVGQGRPADELESLLGPHGHDRLPDDPALARLLPDAYTDDPQSAAEFRRYTEESLRAAKIDAARAVLASLPAGGGEVVLTGPECEPWLRALNDVRLVLGTRLGVTEEDSDFVGDHPLDQPHTAYYWLTDLLNSLVESLT